ncbi:DUF742 domain-containing protein [Streptomyces sp. NPDC088785]|uniref:DUF742 domain-containing protein n=1 Tax=Streptomyces sp. NPDC088785 TaxID=3365897 RepID=UPI00380F2400
MDNDADYRHHLDDDLSDAPRGSAGARAPRTSGSQWFDREAGPMVRPYTVTAGRTAAGPEGARCDVIALVSLDDAVPTVHDDTALGPEHRSILEMCRVETRTVAELAAGAEVPVGVVRVLLGDLLDLGRVKVTAPVPPIRLPVETILREVIDGLRAL